MTAITLINGQELLRSKSNKLAQHKINVKNANNVNMNEQNKMVRCVLDGMNGSDGICLRQNEKR